MSLDHVRLNHFFRDFPAVPLVRRILALPKSAQRRSGLRHRRVEWKERTLGEVPLLLARVSDHWQE